MTPENYKLAHESYIAVKRKVWGIRISMPIYNHVTSESPSAVPRHSPFQPNFFFFFCFLKQLFPLEPGKQGCLNAVQGD